MQDAILSLNRMRELLQIEYEEEKNSFHTLADKIGISRLVDRGNAWYPVSVASTRYNSLDQRVVEIEREPVEDSDHSMADLLCFSPFRVPGEKNLIVCSPVW